MVSRIYKVPVPQCFTPEDIGTPQNRLAAIAYSISFECYHCGCKTLLIGDHLAAYVISRFYKLSAYTDIGNESNKAVTVQLI